MTGIVGCCARAASGHASVAPPSAEKNCRLPIAICPNGITSVPTGRSATDFEVDRRRKGSLLLLRMREAGIGPKRKAPRYQLATTS